MSPDYKPALNSLKSPVTFFRPASQKKTFGVLCKTIAPTFPEINPVR